MKNMTEEEYQRKLSEIKNENIQNEYKKRLKEERAKYGFKLKLETSKLIAVYLFALLNAIVVYAMIAMWNFADLTYLGVLISDIAAQVIIYAIYCMKAYKAKKSEENLKFEREKLSGALEDVLSAGAESREYVPTTTGTVDTYTEQNYNVG
ncbi:MAG: hypothetical protein SPE24_09130 [Erysipelotrichaceae bacterium]|nr:hypothetical protein [Erysipelotrichaceae bacterium]